MLATPLGGRFRANVDLLRSAIVVGVEGTRTLTGLILGILLLGATLASAQEVTITGLVTDSSGGVLPGVSVTARHSATGTVYETVTDTGGRFRVPARVGEYTVTLTLAGFATVAREGLVLQLGQTVEVSLQMAPATLNETVTVTGEAPLVDTTTSRLGGNVDVRQMQELPINGRDWLQLTALAPGARGVAITTGAPVTADDNQVMQSYQLSVDGQRVNQSISNGSYNPKSTSRDALGEFEYITSRFDATQGHATGVQVNAVTKAGTNIFSGTASGYFRSDRFAAKDFVANRVLPFSNQQVSGTFGGPILRDRIHFFGYTEYERAPRTLLFTSPFPAFNITVPQVVSDDRQGGGRVDIQLSRSMHLMARMNIWKGTIPLTGGGATSHPSAMTVQSNRTTQAFSRLTQTLGNRTVNEIRVGYAPIHRLIDTAVQCARQPGLTPLATPRDCRPPQILLAGYTLGTGTLNPQDVNEENYQVADTFTLVSGSHQLKVGGEYHFTNVYLEFGQGRYGVIDATGGPIPTNIQAIFPVWDDWSTWNLAALSPITRNYQVGFGAVPIRDPRHVFAAFVQDDWKVTDALTLNLGVRYDVTVGAMGEKLEAYPPFRMPGDIKGDHNNIAPRVGAAYSLPGGRTVLRGGYGKYFGTVVDTPVLWTAMTIRTLTPSLQNDGRPNFASDPFNGQIPTFDTVRQLIPRLDLGGIGIIDPKDFETLYGHQASVGIERQLQQNMSWQVDYVFKGNRELIYRRNDNLIYNPTTGANYPASDLSRRPYADYGMVLIQRTGGRSNSHSIDTGFTKRYADRWQLSGTYSLSWLKDQVAPPPVSNAPPDLYGEYAYAVGDQRHRAVVNGIWQAPLDIQLSGLYFFGSGERRETSIGQNLRDNSYGPFGSCCGGLPNRLRRDGTLVPRNGFVGDPIHRVDVRIQRGFPLVGRLRVDGILEVFNLFNHANYGTYVTVEGNAAYGRPVQNTNVAYSPRMAQFGFRLSF